MLSRILKSWYRWRLGIWQVRCHRAKLQRNQIALELAIRPDDRLLLDFWDSSNLWYAICRDTVSSLENKLYGD
jgi:hypothetical protein